MKKRRSGLYEGLQGLFSTALGGSAQDDEGLVIKDSDEPVPTPEEIDKMKFNNPDFKVEDEKIDTQRLLRSRIPTFYMKPEEKKKQRIIIIKMFEKGTNYAKIIPRTISYITQKRLKYKKFDEDFNISEIEVEYLIKLMRQDDPWLEEVSPIVSIRLFDEQTKKLIEVTGKEVLKITDEQETRFSFFVKRKHGYLGEDEIKVFDSFKEAMSFVKKFNQDPNANACRYYDLYHHGYTIIDSSIQFPVYRAGTSLVKILIQKKENIQIKKEPQVLETPSVVKEEDVVIEEYKFDIEYNKNQNLLEVYEFSRFVNTKLIPLQDHECTLESEKVRVVAWKKIKQLPKSRAELLKIKRFTDLGIPPKLRKQIYFTATETIPDEKEYETNCRKLFETYYPPNFKIKEVHPLIYPSFGGELKPTFYFLNEVGEMAAKRILCVLGFNHPELEYCPRIVHICCLLLTVMEEFECCQVIQNMIRMSKGTNLYLRPNIYENHIHFYSFDKMIEKYAGKIAAHLRKINFDFLSFHRKWYNEFCHEIMPFRNLFGIFDRYMVIGLNELCESAYSVLKSNEKVILTLKTKEQVEEYLKTRTPSDVDLFKYKISFNVKAFEPQVKPFVDQLNLHSKFDRYTRPVILDQSKIINHPKQWEYLCHNLPFAKRLRKLSLIYTTKKDGYNLISVYSTVKDKGSIIILIEASPIDPNSIAEVNHGDTHIIGVYCGEEVNLSNSYEGTTDTMVFALHPKCKSYRWTKKNDYFSLGKENSVSFGGGGAGPALSFDSNLYRGTSYSCDTFDNSPLCGKFHDFLISSVEIYSFKM